MVGCLPSGTARFCLPAIDRTALRIMDASSRIHGKWRDDQRSGHPRNARGSVCPDRDRTALLARQRAAHQPGSCSTVLDWVDTGFAAGRETPATDSPEEAVPWQDLAFQSVTLFASVLCRLTGASFLLPRGRSATAPGVNGVASRLNSIGSKTRISAPWRLSGSGVTAAACATIDSACSSRCAVPALMEPARRGHALPGAGAQRNLDPPADLSGASGVLLEAARRSPAPPDTDANLPRSPR